MQMRVLQKEKEKKRNCCSHARVVKTTNLFLCRCHWRIIFVVGVKNILKKSKIIQLPVMETVRVFYEPNRKVLTLIKYEIKQRRCF